MARPPTGITKRGNTYQAWVYDRHLKTKRYKTFETQGAAKAWRANMTVSVDSGTMRAPTRQTLREAGEAWLDACERGEVLSRKRQPYKPSTLRGYRSDLDAYVLPDYGAHRLADITGDDLQALVDRLVGSGLSGQRVRNIVTGLQALYRRHRRQVFADPTRDLDLPEPGKRREHVVTARQAAELLKALPADDRAAWATAAYGGLRLGELRGLRVGDVDLDAGTISVQRGWDVKQGPIAPKSKAGVRTVPAPATLTTILRDHIARTGRTRDDLIFGRSRSEPFTDSHLRKRARTAWAATAIGSFLRSEPATLEPIGFHECRHSYSSFLDDAGISEVRADRYMGHSNYSMHARYTHQLEAQLAEDANRLDEYLTGAASGTVVAFTGAKTGAEQALTRMVAQGA